MKLKPASHTATERINFRVTPGERKQFDQFKKKYKLSARQVLAISTQPCNCNGKETFFDKETGEVIDVPRGILKINLDE